VSTVLRASPPPQAARPIPRGCPVEGHAPSPHGFPVLRSISVYRHAVVNTPVARWVLIARGTAYSNRFPVPSGGGLPHIPARSATTLDFSRPAQRSLAITACRLAESPKRPVCLEGSDGFVTSIAAPIATGWSDPVAGWELHPLKTNTSRFTAHRYGVPETQSRRVRGGRSRPAVVSLVVIDGLSPRCRSARVGSTGFGSIALPSCKS
jgi:hypothetical protein